MDFSAVSIAEGVAAGEVSPAAVIAEHVSRHRKTHASINALVQPRHESATGEVHRLESELRRGSPGLLAGVPVSVKECFAVAGLVTSLGIPSRRRAVDGTDAVIVERLRSAGAIVVGKANVPQAMYLHETDNPVWGRTNHPGDVGRGPGGSSGGDAALVAAGVVPLAVGTDLAGSVRQPAHVCGIAGFLPRTAVLGGGGSFDTMPELMVVKSRAGFLARTVGDLELAFAATCAPVGTAPRRHPGRSLRVGWWDDAGPIEPSPAVRRAVHEAVGRLARAGVEVVPVDGGLAEEAAWLLLALLSADGGSQVRRLFAGTRPIPSVARLLRLAALPMWLRPLLAAAAQAAGRRLEARAVRSTGPRRGAAFDALVARREDLKSRFAALVGSCDALLCPVSALPALPHGTASRLLLAAAPCLLANLLDLPAGAVPVTRVRPEEESKRGASRDPVIRAAAATDRGSRGLPVGVQIIGVPETVPPDDPSGPERVVLECMRIVAGA